MKRSHLDTFKGWLNMCWLFDSTIGYLLYCALDLHTLILVSHLVGLSKITSHIIVWLFSRCIVSGVHIAFVNLIFNMMNRRELGLVCCHIFSPLKWPSTTTNWCPDSTWKNACMLSKLPLLHKCKKTRLGCDMFTWSGQRQYWSPQWCRTLGANQTREPPEFYLRWETACRMPYVAGNPHGFSTDHRASIFKGWTHPFTCWLPKSIIPLSSLFKQHVPNQKWMTALAWVMHSYTVCFYKYVYDVSQLLS